MKKRDWHLEEGNEPKQGNEAYKFSMKDKKNRGSKAGVKCYNCEKFGHYKNECPEIRNKDTTRKRDKEATTLARTWRCVQR